MLKNNSAVLSRTLPILLGCALALGALASVPGATALASHSESVYFEGSTDLLTASTRPHAIAQLQTLGVKALRVELSWYNVAPGQKSATKPAFDPTNPASYSWGEYDALIGEAQRLHWKVLLTVTSPAPRWATSNKAAPYVTSPDDQDFQQFMTAVGRHYGTSVLYSIWNEPNHPAFLRPQFTSKGKPASPRIYRGLYQSGYAGLQAAGIARPQVLMGETAPFGYDTVNVRKEGSRALLHDVAPLAFLREMLCLNAKYKKAGSCSELQTAGYAHHAYTLPAGPYYKPPQRDDVTIGVLSRLSNALNAAARAHAIPGGRADLPHRVRRAERAQPRTRRIARQAGPVRRDRRAHRLEQSARGGLLAVPAQGRSRSVARPDRASTAAPSASRPASRPSRASPSRCTRAGRCR